MRYFMLLLLLLPFAHAAYISPCDDPGKGVYVVQYPSLPGEIYVKLYAGRGSDVSYDDFRDSKGFVDGVEFTLGAEFCLLKSMPEDYPVKDGDTFWNVWERYGTARGITFRDFVEREYDVVVPGTLDPFEKNKDCNPLSSCGITSLQLDYIASEERHLEIREANKEILETLEDELDPASHMFDLTGDHDLDGLEQEAIKKSEESSQSLKAVVIPEELFMDGSLSLGGIAQYAYGIVFPDFRNGNILAVILDGHAVSLAYPRTTHIDDLDRNIFDEVIAGSSSYLESGDTEGLIAMIQEEMVDGAYLAEHGVEILGQSLYMNGNPIVSDYEISSQDLGTFKKKPFRDYKFYLYPRCGDEFNDRLDFAERIEEQVVDSGAEAEIVIDANRPVCVPEDTALWMMSGNDPGSVLVSIDSTDSQEQEARFTSVMGGMLAYMIQSSVLDGNDPYFDKLKRMDRNYMILANTDQIAIELVYHNDDLGQSWWDSITSIFTRDDPDDPLVTALKKFALWQELETDARLDYEFYEGSLDEMIDSASQDETVKIIIRGIIMEESEAIPMSVSPPGCKGVMHFCSYVSRNYPAGDTLCDKDKGCLLGYDERYDAELSIKAGAGFLEDMLAKYNEPRLVLAAYYGGEPLVDRALQDSGSDQWIRVKEKITPELIEEVYCSGECRTGYFADPETRQGLSEKIKKDVEEVYSIIGPSLSASHQ